MHTYQSVTSFSICSLFFVLFPLYITLLISIITLSTSHACLALISPSLCITLLISIITLSIFHALLLSSLALLSPGPSFLFSFYYSHYVFLSSIFLILYMLPCPLYWDLALQLRDKRADWINKWMNNSHHTIDYPSRKRYTKTSSNNHKPKRTLNRSRC